MRASAAADGPGGRQSEDEKSYVNLAYSLAEDRQYGGRNPAALRWPPGAPMLFAAAETVVPTSGEAGDTRQDIPAAYWLQLLVGVVAIGVAYLLGVLLAGHWAGVAVAALVAFYPPFIRLSGTLLSEPLGILLLLCAVTALVWGLRKPGILRFAIAGAFLGLTLLTRANLILVPLALILFLAIWSWRAHGQAHSLRFAGAFVVGCLLMVAPWITYASLRLHTFVPITKGGGSALFVGTYLPGDGTLIGVKREFGSETKLLRPDLRHLRNAELPGRAVLNTVAARHPQLERQAALRREAAQNLHRYAVGEPDAFGAMALSKLGDLWLVPSRAGSTRTYPHEHVAHPALVAFLLLLTIGAIGVRRDPAVVVTIVLLFAATVLHLLFVAQPRYSLPLLPLLFASGCAGAVVLAQRARQQQSLDRRPLGE